MSTIYSGGLTTKDPEAVEFFAVNWGTRKLAEGVGITTSTWTITGADSLLTKADESIDGQTTRLKLSGGTLGKKYVVTNHIVTNEAIPQEDDASFTVLIASK